MALSPAAQNAQDARKWRELMRILSQENITVDEVRVDRGFKLNVSKNRVRDQHDRTTWQIKLRHDPI